MKMERAINEMKLRENKWFILRNSSTRNDPWFSFLKTCRYIATGYTLSGTYIMSIHSATYGQNICSISTMNFNFSQDYHHLKSINALR